MAYQHFRVGSWQADSTTREITSGSCTRRLSPRAMGVLVVLAEAGGAVVSRDDLMDAVWPDVHVGDDSLTQAVTELRRTLGQKKDTTPYIVTVPKSGYRLVAPVVPLGAQPDAPAATDQHPDLPLRAHLLVSEARQLRWLYGYMAYDRMKELMDEALAIAPGSALVQAEYATLVGCTILHRGDNKHRSEAALRAARRAVALRPDLTNAQCALGFVSGSIGRKDECTEAFERALAIDPRNAETHALAAQAFFGLGAMQHALVLAERGASLDTDDILSPYVAARAAIALRQPDRAAIAARMCLVRADARLLLAPDSVRASSVRAAALAMLGQKEDAWLEARRSAGEPNFRDMVALAGIQRIDAALDSLEALLDNGWRTAGWLLNDPVFGQLGDGSRYKRLAHHFLHA